MKTRVCIVSQRYYPGDPRMLGQITNLLEAGYAVDVVCMQGKNQPFHRVEDGVTLYRIPSVERVRAGKLRYMLEYVSFFLPALFLMAYLQIARGYRLVTVTNLPDLLVFSALIPKLLGAKVIFDLRECTPEMFMDRFGAAPDSRIVKIMAAIERASIRFADASLTCTEQMRQKQIGHGNPPNKITVWLNVTPSSAQRTLILPDPSDNMKAEFRLVTHGTITKRYGLDLLIEALAEILPTLPQTRLTIFGKGEDQPRLEEMVARLGLKKEVTFAGFVDEDVLIAGIHHAHVGVIPLRQNPESDLILTNKMYDYIQLGVPVMSSRTTAVAAAFDDQSVCMFKANDSHALAEALIDFANDPEKRRSMAENALKIYGNYASEKQQSIFVTLVNRLLAASPRAPQQVEVKS